MPTPSASSAGVTAWFVPPPGKLRGRNKDDRRWIQNPKLETSSLSTSHATCKLLTFESSWLSNLPGLNNALPSLKASPKRLSLRNFTALGLWILLIIPRKIPFLNFYFFLLEKFLEKHYERSSGVTSQRKSFFRTWKSERQYIAGRVPGGLVFGNQKILGFRKSYSCSRFQKNNEMHAMKNFGVFKENASWFWWLRTWIT